MLANLAETSSLSSGDPNSVSIAKNNPFVEFARSLFPRNTGPARPLLSSKLFGVAEIAASAL